MVMAIGDQGDLGPADLAAYEVQETAAAHRALRGVRGAGARRRPRQPARHAARPRAARRPRARWPSTWCGCCVTMPVEGTPRAWPWSMPTETRARSRPASGLSSGVWLADLGIHLNSMLGEGELVRGDEVPGRRMGSMMSPLVVRRDGAPVLVAGAAGGSRIRSALLQVLVNVLHRGMPVHEAIHAPRLNPVLERVHVEPGFPADVLAALQADNEVVTWPALDSYFGGVAAIGVSGPGADPRRGGDVRRILSDPLLGCPPCRTRNVLATPSSRASSSPRPLPGSSPPSCCCASARSSAIVVLNSGGDDDDSTAAGDTPSVRTSRPARRTTTPTTPDATAATRRLDCTDPPAAPDEPAAVRQGARPGDGRGQDLRGHGRDQLRRHHARARRREGTADGGVVRAPGRGGLLRRHALPPARGVRHLRAPVRRPDRSGLGRSGIRVRHRERSRRRAATRGARWRWRAPTTRTATAASSSWCTRTRPCRPTAVATLSSAR